MEYPLRTLVMAAQVQAGMWRRNGYAVINQVGDLAVSQSVGRSVGPSVGRSVRRLVRPSVRRSIGPSVSLSLRQVGSKIVYKINMCPSNKIKLAKHKTTIMLHIITIQCIIYCNIKHFPKNLTANLDATVTM